MTRQKSELLKAMGTGFEIVKGLTDEVLALDGNDEDLRRILKDEALRRKIAELIVKKADGTTYSVTADYDLSLQGMIRKGKYDWVNPDITAEHFPLTGQGEVNVVIELVHYGRVMTTDEVLKEFDKQGLRPANTAEFLAFGAQHQEVQRQFPVVCVDPGSVWRHSSGLRLVPFLWRSSGKRRLHLDWFDSKWSAHYRFAGVRK